MRTISILLFLHLSTTALSQVTSAQQKAFNGYVEYANRSAEEVAAVVKSIIVYFPSLHQKSSWGGPRYVCPVQLEDYYLNNATNLSKSLSAVTSSALNTKLKELRMSAEKIDMNCKSLDTYHKLEDYKQDNFAKAETLINELQILLGEYAKKQRALQLELEAQFKKLAGTTPQTAYHKADEMLRNQVAKERSFIDSWTFNLKENVHTGWSVEKLQQSIQDTDTQLATLKKYKPALEYPTSSVWSNFQESLSSVLETKRTGLDQYNFEAKKSDKHSNDVYLGLINYFNGTLVSNYNMFIQYAEQNNYRGLKVMNYFPLFEIRIQEKKVDVDVKKFKDITRTPVTIAAQKIAIPKTVYASLSNYIDYLNETWRQTRYMQMVLSSFNSSASYYKALDSFERRGGMSFDYKDFQLPLSYYQKTVADSKVLSPAIAKILNDQAEVILNVLKEMDDLAASLEIETKERTYEKDHLKKVYEILEREKELLDIWDDKKELLYEDARKVFDSYAPLNASSSWYVSGKALQKLTDLDHEGVFKAKAYYKTDPSIQISTEKIDENLRDVIAKEYDNMKGIEKIGRNNGLCPYTPYEDLPLSSKALSEALRNIKPSTASRYQHPYYKVIYHYNDIVDDHNKFSELSKDIPLLKTVKQPELFVVEYPGKKSEKIPEATVAKHEKPQETAKVENTPVASTPTASSPTVPEPKVQSQEPPVRIVEKQRFYMILYS